MKPISIYLLFTLLAASAMSQQKMSMDPGKQPYVLVDTFRTDMKSLILSPVKIESINVFKDTTALQAYGNKAKYGAVIVKTKPNTELHRLGDLLDKYNVANDDRKLRVCIDQVLISNPELILIDPAEVLAVDTITGQQLINSGDQSNSEKFLNIKTAKKDK
jgi:hypothetical protein